VGSDVRFWGHHKAVVFKFVQLLIGLIKFLYYNWCPKCSQYNSLPDVYLGIFLNCTQLYGNLANIEILVKF
jgi:hypothetical protein